MPCPCRGGAACRPSSGALLTRSCSRRQDEGPGPAAPAPGHGARGDTALPLSPATWGAGTQSPHPRRKGLLPLPGPYQHKHLSDMSGGPWGRGPRHATARTSRPSPHGAGRAWTAHQLAGSAGHCWGRLGCVWVSSPGRRSSQSPSTAGPPATWGPRRGDSSRTLNFTRTQHPGAVHPRPQRSVRPVTLGMKGEHTALGG